MANGQVERCYEALVLGEPKQADGRVETNIGRDVRDRKRMGVFPWQGSRWVVCMLAAALLPGRPARSLPIPRHGPGTPPMPQRMCLRAHSCHQLPPAKDCRAMVCMRFRAEWLLGPRQGVSACTLASRGRHAVSEYSVLEALAGGGAAWVQWRLRTGRTHQIRVHARHLGHPLLGDEAYGGAGGSAVAAIGRGKAARCAV